MMPIYFLLYLLSFKTHLNYYPAPPQYQPAPWVNAPAEMQVAGLGLVFPACTTTVVGKGQTVTTCR